MQDLISEIVEREWDFFQHVNNAGGRAYCQDDRKTFDIMRKSQFMAWNKDVCESYLNDLITAETEQRNPLMEKYAYMMEYTSPFEYAQIKDKLPPVSEETQKLTTVIVGYHLQWHADFTSAYPRLANAGRPASQTFMDVTSVEVYLRGELYTYSPATLNRYFDMVRDFKTAGINLNQRIEEHTVKMYGYRSLDQAEESLAVKDRQG